MKVLTILAAIFLQTGSTYIQQDLKFPVNNKIMGCIPIILQPPSSDTLQEYSRIQIITDLLHLPLREIAQREVVSERNGNYNRFLSCSWQIYEYQTKYGEINFDPIEKALRDALTQEVGGTGPGINLSKIEAKRIINLCRTVTDVTPGLTVVKIQNCILREIQHIGKP